MKVDAWRVRMAARALLFAPVFGVALVGLALYRVAECVIGIGADPND